MRVPAFRRATDINLDDLERRLRREGADQASLDDPLSEIARLVDSSRNSPPSPLRSGTSAPGDAGTGEEVTEAFEVGTLSPSDEAHDRPTEATAADCEVPQADDAGDLQAWDRGMAEEATRGRSRRRNLIAAALAFAGVAMIGAVFALEKGVPRPAEQRTSVAATNRPTEAKPPNDGTVAVLGDPGASLQKDSVESTKVTVAKEQPTSSSAQPALTVAPPPVGATPDVDLISPAAEALSAPPVPAKVDTSAVQAAPPLAQSPAPKPLRSVSVRPDGTPIATPVSIQSSSSADLPKPPAKSAPEATSDAVGTARPLISTADAPTKRLKSRARGAVAKAGVTGSAAPAIAPSEPISPGTPAKPDKEAGAPISAQAVAEADAAPASPAEDAKQSFDRVLHTFGGLFGSSTQPVPKAAAAPAGWGVQLAAPKSEAEAKRDLTRLNAKYASTLKGSTIGVHKAMVKGETVYRLRVVDLSQADAVALCARLKGEGGNCFVAR